MDCASISDSATPRSFAICTTSPRRTFICLKSCSLSVPSNMIFAITTNLSARNFLCSTWTTRTYDFPLLSIPSRESVAISDADTSTESEELNFSTSEEPSTEITFPIFAPTLCAFTSAWRDAFLQALLITSTSSVSAFLSRDCVDTLSTNAKLAKSNSRESDSCLLCEMTFTICDAVYPRKNLLPFA